MFQISALMKIQSNPRTWHYGVLVMLACLMSLSGNADLPLIDRDEPRFAQATREMIQRGEWVIPYFNDEYRFDKPVMIYWLMRAGFFLWGSDSEFPARLPSALATLLVGIVIYEIGRRRFDTELGLWAAGGWLTCLQVLLHGRLAVADMPLILAITVANWAIWELLERDRFDRHWFIALYGSMGFGFLVKGPLAFLCPLLTLMLYRWVFWRKSLAWGKLKLHWGLPLSIAIIGLWGIPALYESGGLFWDKGMGKHVIERGMTPFNGRSFTPFFYVESSMVSLFPGIAFVGGIGAALRKRWSPDQAFLVAWLAGPYLIFSFYATQLSHYVLPAYPAAFLLLAQAARVPREQSRWRTPILYIFCGIGLFLAMILGGIALFEDFPSAMLPIRSLVACSAGILFGLTAVVWLLDRRWVYGGMFALLLVGFCLGLTGIYLRQLAPAVQLESLLKGMPENTQYYFEGFEEPSLIYYSNRHWDRLPSDAAMPAIISAPGSRLVVTLQDETRLDAYWSQRIPWISPPKNRPMSERKLHLLGELQASARYQFLETVGINPARMSWVKVVAWYKIQ
jgi:4-amino-4-deoxy-L-arabinose transferase-like glycosyltransferase